MTQKKLLVVLILALTLTSCDDPVREAKARAIDAETSAIVTETTLQERERTIEIEDKKAISSATRDDRIAFRENLWWWGTVSSVVLLAVAISLSIASIGGGIALARRAQLRACLVRLDRTTRTWPVLLDLKTGIVVDLETGERAKIGDVRSLDHRRLIISGQVRTTGLLAQAAAEIAKAAKDAQPGDMLPAIGQSVPILSIQSKEELDG